MLKPNIHHQESDRIKALKALSLLDTMSEKEFDEITFLASKICGTPIALISLVDENRQWFKSKQGLTIDETPRDVSFCGHAILGDDIFYVPNALEDKRFADNPLVVGESHIEFYAGIAICDPVMGLPIGTLCVIDNRPNQLSAEQFEALRSLKNQVQRLLKLRSQLEASKELESQLKVQNQRFEFILEGAKLGSWDWWLDTNVVHFDRIWCEMLGLDPNTTENVLATWDALVHPDDKAKAYEDIKSYLNGTANIYENLHRLRHTSGDWVWILDRGRISEWHADGRPKRFTGTHFDVTKQVKSEKQLEEAQSITKIGSWSFDLRTHKQSWSKEHYNIFEIDFSHSEDTLFQAYRERIHPDDLPELDRILERAVSFAEGFVYNHRVALDKGKRIKHVQGIGKVSVDINGKAISISGTCQDITKKVEIENELELKRLETIQASKMATLGEMAAGVAHEINNPLAIIKGNIALIQSKQLDNQKVEERINTVMSCIDRIAKIVKGLSQFSRSSASTERESCKVKKLIQDAMFLSDVNAKRQSVKILSDYSGDHEIFCNSVEIEQVLVNLINNSIDAVKESEDRWVSIDVGVDTGSIYLRVMDSGMGIPVEIENKIFQPFFTTKTVGRGTGLGLSISKGIVESHNASISVNKNFRNTCFEIKFKRYKQAEAAA
tara:strand:- start:19587 stop:21587 length:2001 start_codon:yes stop_codon:yes gene_type:complete